MQLMPLAEAIALPLEVLGQLSIEDLAFDVETRAATARAWLWLRGIDDDSDAETIRRTRVEVLSDGGLFTALNLPAAEFLKWWRCEQWEFFDSHVACGECDDWAWELLDRARAATSRMGTLALQCPLRAPR